MFNQSSLQAMNTINNGINFDCVKKSAGKIDCRYPVMVYIAIGSANNALQQFPPFLRELVATNKTLRLIIVSIDSLHELPPLASCIISSNESAEKCPNGVQAIEMGINIDEQTVLFNFLHINPEMYGERVEMFVYKCNVCVISDKIREKNECIHPNKDIHIHSHLRHMNEYMLSIGGSLLFNMYSGYNISIIAETFDAEHINSLHQIVYGIGGRINHGCFFDMYSESAYFATRKDTVIIQRSSGECITRPVIKMFNYYHHLLNKTVGSHVERLDILNYPRNEIKYINAQINNILVSLWEDFKTTHLFVFRQIYNKAYGLECMSSVEDINLYGGNLSADDINEYNKLLEEKQYNLLYSLVYNKCEEAIDLILKVKKKDIRGREIMSFLTFINNPYEWGAYIYKHFLSDIYTCISIQL